MFSSFEQVKDELVSLGVHATVQEIAVGNTPFSAELLEAAQKVANLRQELSTAISSLNSRLMDVQRYLGRKPAWLPNPLGEVQGAGQTVDRLCADLNSAADHLKVMAKVWAASKPKESVVDAEVVEQREIEAAPAS